MPEDMSGIYTPELYEGRYYIAPDTDIFILSGVPLDNTYEHTILWGKLLPEREGQRDYFLSKAKYGIRKNYYQRVDREWMKISINAEMLYDCNYIMFRNTAFNEYKWFYAFILDVEYINNNTSKIRYEIDVMQTWLPGEGLDYQPLPCFVERCHSISDKLYENLVPESIVNSDEYLVDYIEEFDMNDLNVVTLATEEYVGKDVLGNAKFEPADSTLMFGAFGKVALKTWDINIYSGGEISQLNDYLDTFINAGKADSIVAIMAYPAKFRRGAITTYPDESYPTDMDARATAYLMQLQAPKMFDKLGGMNSDFVPKNMKLYSYPFCYLKVNNECGNSKIYKWELFSEGSRGKFAIIGSYGWQPGVIAYPTKYKNINRNMDDAITLTDFVVCPWSSDAYKAWWAQNAGNVGATALGGIASIGAIAAGVISKNPMLIATGVGSTISSATQIGKSVYESKHLSSDIKADPKVSLLLPMVKALKLAFTKESLRPEMLQIYDDYFTKYGYAQKKIMVPPLKNRVLWTYVQTIGFEFTGKINDRDTKKIKSIFDNGITFWVNPEDIGHYEYDNIPLQFY